MALWFWLVLICDVCFFFFVLFFYIDDLNENFTISSLNTTAPNLTTPQVIKGNVVPHPDLWVSLTYFLH